MACLLAPVAGQLVDHFFNGAGRGFGATADAPLGGAEADFDATVALHPSMAEELVLMR